MKASSLALLLLVSSAAVSLAQTSQVPNLLSYQASVTNASGTPIGATEPVNRTVTFQFYTTSTGGTPVYAESQVVTIANGDFSVLLGNGNGVSGLPGRVVPASPIRSLASITLSPLYLGITVDDGTAAVDAEISPRQELASAAFATRAQIAEGLADGKLATGMVADSAITTVKIGGNQVTTAKIADANITTAKLATGSVTLDKLDTTAIGVWTPNGPNINRTSGNVGIGQPSPGFPLNFSSTVGNKISLYGNSGNHYGLGLQNNLVQIYAGDSSGDVGFGYGSSTAFTETMRIKGNGNLGIGTKTPTSKLHVVGGNAIIDSTTNTALSVLQGGGTGKVDLALAGGAGSYSSSAATNDGVLRAMTGKLHLQSGSGAAAITINTDNVGMGTTTPKNKLDVRGKLSLGDATPDSAFNGALQITRPTSGSQYINLVRSGKKAWSLGYAPNTDTFGIGGGMGTDSSFNPQFMIDTDNRVRIGTTDRLGYLNVGAVSASFNSYGRLNTDGASGSNGYQDTVSLALNAKGRILCERVDISSDKRIKAGFERSDSAGDLDSLLNIEITNYRLIDHVAGGNQIQKKVIAQQVEKIFPAAVSQRPGVIPDVYRHATIQAGWLTISGDFEVGDRLLVIGKDDRELTLEVLTKREGAVQLDSDNLSGEVFVYGRQVDDVRSVDYDAIAMLNVSATQELHRRMVTAQNEAAAKEKRVAELERRLEALEMRLSTTR